MAEITDIGFVAPEDKPPKTIDEELTRALKRGQHHAVPDILRRFIQKETEALAARLELLARRVNECPVCEGTGLANPSEESPDEDSPECPACDGTGRTDE